MAGFCLFISLFIYINAMTSVLPCNIPVDFWCDTAESAKLCNVTNQCNVYKRSLRDPIKVTLMYETLCPYCQRFITNMIDHVYNRYRGLIRLQLVPWGNAVLYPDGTVFCQHGPKECAANLLHSCVLHSANMKSALAFIVCFERVIGTNSVDDSFHQCSRHVRPTLTAIKKCQTGPLGMELQREAAKRTESARPQPVSEVPYLLFNDYSPHQSANALGIMALHKMIFKWAKEVRRS